MLGKIFESKTEVKKVKAETAKKGKLATYKNSAPTAISYPVFATSFALVGGTTTSR